MIEDSLRGINVCMLVWKDVAYDARAVRAARTLAAAGARVLVLSACSEHLPVDQATSGGYELRFVRRPSALPGKGAESNVHIDWIGALFRFVRGLGAQFAFLREALRSKADVFHACDLVPLPVAWLASTLSGQKVVYDAYEISVDREAYRGFSGLVKSVEGYLVRRVDGFITTTESRAEYFASLYGVSRPAVVQNRPQVGRGRGYRSIRQALELPESAFVFLYQGGLQRGRGLPEIIEAAAEVDDAHFVFIGSGALSEDLVRLAGASDASERIHFLPAVPSEELIEWTRSADVGLQLLQNTCLNHYTTDSNKLFEYGLAGLPVLASDFPEIRKVITAHRFGILVDPADRQAVAREMRRLVRDTDLRKRLAAAAVEAESALSWTSQQGALLVVYRKCIADDR